MKFLDPLMIFYVSKKKVLCKQKKVVWKQNTTGAHRGTSSLTKKLTACAISLQKQNISFFYRGLQTFSVDLQNFLHPEIEM